MRDAEATVSRDGSRLVFAGALMQSAIAALWRGLPRDAGRIDAFDLSAVTRLDSAGLALLSWLLARHPEATMIGSPQGLAGLRAAYRMDERLAFTR